MVQAAWLSKKWACLSQDTAGPGWVQVHDTSLGSQSLGVSSVCRWHDRGPIGQTGPIKRGTSVRMAVMEATLFVGVPSQLMGPQLPCWLAALLISPIPFLPSLLHPVARMVSQSPTRTPSLLDLYTFEMLLPTGSVDLSLSSPQNPLPLPGVPTVSQALSHMGRSPQDE